MSELVSSETWRVIPEYPNYEVSDLGQVISTMRPIPVLLRGGMGGNGYRFVTLTRYKTTKHFRVHKLVALAFLGVSRLIVNHKNGIKTDNRLENLEYVTHQGNSLHDHYVLGRNLGEKCLLSKLKSGQVLEIRRRFKLGITTKTLAGNYGVSRDCIRKIVRRICWKHLPEVHNHV